MSEFFTQYWPHIVSVVSGLVAMWTFASKLHKSFLGHFRSELRDTFASREQIEKLDAKVDSLLAIVWKRELQADMLYSRESESHRDNR